MKKLILLLLFTILLTNFVCSEDFDCQYPETITELVNQTVLVYDGTSVKVGEALIISDFNNGSVASFVVTNPNSERIMVIFNFTIEGTGAKNLQYGKWINAEEQIQIREVCREGGVYGNCSKNSETLFYYVSKPEIIYPKEIEVTIEETICLGANGDNCIGDSDCNSGICNSLNYCGEIDDGKKCEEDADCVSDICNSLGYCGKLEDGRDCNEDLECVSGVCNTEDYCGVIIECRDNTTTLCNNVECKVPSTKEVGEAYSCEWECNSGRGKDGVCSYSFVNIIIFFAIIGLAFGVSAYYIREAITGGKARDKAKKVIKEAQDKLEEINHDLESKKKEKERLNSELLITEETKEKKIKLNKEIDELTTKQREKSKALKVEREKLTKERLTVRTNKQGYKVYINENGYEVFERTGTLFHRWWFEHNHNRKIKIGYEIHHKDFNKKNNHINNLEELDHETHRKKHRSRYNK
ncbi:MAG: hypothetical protein KJ896_03260 [Nanoarchaeota archaeon]|nr:hypothetical protein [Nanoarchaeota archaeon]